MGNLKMIDQTGRGSGSRVIVGPNGNAIGRLQLDDLWLDDDELSRLVKRHEEHKRSNPGASAVLSERAKELAETQGIRFSEALKRVSRDAPDLVLQHRREVVGAVDGPDGFAD